MILIVKLNKDTTIHDLQKMHKDFEETYEMEVSLSHTHDVMELKVSKQVSIHEIQEVIGTCGELYVDIGFMDSVMNTMLNPGTYTTTGTMSKEAFNKIFEKKL